MLLIVAVSAAILALPFASAQAADIASLQAKVDQARSQARNLASGVQMRTAELQAALEDALVRGRARLARVRAAAEAAHQRLLVAQARYRRSQRLLSVRLVSIYKSDVPDITTVLLESDGFSDLLTRVAYLKEINRADSALLSRVEGLRDGVRSWLGRVRELRGLAAAEVGRMTSARDEVARIRAAAEQRAAALTRARAAQQAALASLRSRISGWTAQVASLQAAMGQAGNAGSTVGQWLGDFSIPQSVVMCESGGNYRAKNPSSGAGGAYQFLPETYKGLGGKYAAPEAAPKWEQDQLAEKLWNGGAGAGNWECAK
jgi:peptidoglycan hydrolase CwlO-like protein